jgi:protein tyrosine phosphatase
VNRKYIAAQAPLPGTIEDFWHMIGQFKVRVVVMLCNVVENSVVKCVQYWPLKVGEKVELSYGILETTKEMHFEHFTCREISFKSERFGEFITYQLHYTQWPDHGRPDTVKS